METVLLMPGPTHLFFTTGIYYTYLLQKKFRVVLLLESHFNPQPELILEGIKKFTTNVVVECVSPGGTVLYASKLFRKSNLLFDTFQPRCVFLHNTVYPHNMYFLREARKRGATVFQYLNGLMTEDDERDWNLYAVGKKNYYSSLIDMVQSVLYYKWFPLLVTHRFFYPDFDVFRGRRIHHRRGRRDPVDFYLVYSEREKDILKRMEDKDEKVMVVRHPVETIGAEIHQRLFADIEKTGEVLILPTTGRCDFLVEQGIDAAVVTAQWREVVGILLSKFSSRVLIKLHPGQKDDQWWKQIFEVIASTYGEKVALVPPHTQVQELILKSRVIVSEVSSVLWWAKFIPEKIIISLDLFKVPLGDHFKGEEGIYYFNDIEALRKTEVRPFSSPERHSLPDLDAFLRCLG